MPKKPTLSIVVLSYNTKDLLHDCLNSLKDRRREIDLEVIVSDNGSEDGSPEMVEKRFPWARLIKIGENVGFAAGNNKARKLCKGKYLLFLNSDTFVYKGTLKETVQYLEDHIDVGAITCKIVLPDGSLDKDARRSFITPWTGLVHIFLKLDRMFPKSKLFAQYWYGYIAPNKVHEVDALQGAFFLVRKKTLDSVDWFDEDYFLDGEDIDLSWKIKNAGWRIIYYPKVKILHIKGVTKGINIQTKKRVSLKEKMKFRMSGVNSMEIFYKKRLWEKYPLALNLLVLLGIRVTKLGRLIKLILLG